jgi:hypothetical protein
VNIAPGATRSEGSLTLYYTPSIPKEAGSPRSVTSVVPSLQEVDPVGDGDQEGKGDQDGEADQGEADQGEADQDGEADQRGETDQQGEADQQETDQQGETDQQEADQQGETNRPEETNPPPPKLIIYPESVEASTISRTAKAPVPCHTAKGGSSCSHVSCALSNIFPAVPPSWKLDCNRQVRAQKDSWFARLWKRMFLGGYAWSSLIWETKAFVRYYEAKRSRVMLYIHPPYSSHTTYKIEALVILIRCSTHCLYSLGPTAIRKNM